MAFEDISARMKALKGSSSAQDAENKPYDHEESYRLRGKMLGVLIRDARLNAARTIEDCARLLRVTPEVIESWEYGDAVPDLPQLELLAYYLDVHISHFWGTQTIENDRTKKIDAQTEYMALRHRMIGALLRQAREEAGLTVAEVAEKSHMDVEQIELYEVGDVPIPMNALPILSNAVNKNMSYFLESSSYIGDLLNLREEWRQFLELDEETREFAANPLNIGFIKIAMTFAKMPTDELRKVAEGLLEITM